MRVPNTQLWPKSESLLRLAQKKKNLNQLLMGFRQILGFSDWALFVRDFLFFWVFFFICFFFCVDDLNVQTNRTTMIIAWFHISQAIKSIETCDLNLVLLLIRTGGFKQSYFWWNIIIKLMSMKVVSSMKTRSLLG